MLMERLEALVETLHLEHWCRYLVVAALGSRQLQAGLLGLLHLLVRCSKELLVLMVAQEQVHLPQVHWLVQVEQEQVEDFRLQPLLGLLAGMVAPACPHGSLEGLGMEGLFQRLEPQLQV